MAVAQVPDNSDGYVGYFVLLCSAGDGHIRLHVLGGVHRARMVGVRFHTNGRHIGFVGANLPRFVWRRLHAQPIPPRLPEGPLPELWL